jgi:hypothetical protein
MSANRDYVTLPAHPALPVLLTSRRAGTSTLPSRFDFAVGVSAGRPRGRALRPRRPRLGGARGRSHLDPCGHLRVDRAWLGGCRPVVPASQHDRVTAVMRSRSSSARADGGFVTSGTSFGRARSSFEPVARSFGGARRGCGGGGPCSAAVTQCSARARCSFGRPRRSSARPRCSSARVASWLVGGACFLLRGRGRSFQECTRSVHGCTSSARGRRPSREEGAPSRRGGRPRRRAGRPSRERGPSCAALRHD